MPGRLVVFCEQTITFRSAVRYVSIRQSILQGTTLQLRRTQRKFLLQLILQTVYRNLLFERLRFAVIRMCLMVVILWFVIPLPLTRRYVDPDWCCRSWIRKEWSPISVSAFHVDCQLIVSNAFLESMNPWHSLRLKINCTTVWIILS